MLIKKHHYLEFLKCKKAFLYSFNNKKNNLEDKKNIDELNSVKNFVYKNFENIFDACGDNEKITIDERINKTEQLIKNNNILVFSNCTFLYKKMFCVIDILEKNGDNTYSIYKIKSSTNIKKHIKNIYNELSFQVYVLLKNNFKIKNCFIFYLNKNYVRNGDIDIKKLFLIEKLDNKKINSCIQNLEENINEMENIIQKQKIEYCNKCYGDCSFFDLCHDNLPPNNVTEINGINKKYANDLIEKGIITFSDLKKNNITFKDFRKQIQINTCLSKKTKFVNKKEIKKFLKILNILYII